MIEVFREEKSEMADWIEGELKAMVVGYKRILIDAGSALTEFGKELPLPFIRDNGNFITGREAIINYLRELDIFVEAWRRYQSDACYIDEDGEIC